MRVRTYVAVAVILAVLASGAWAADPQPPKVIHADIDLSVGGGERPIAPGTIAVRLVNRAPGVQYRVTVRVVSIPIDPLEAPGAGPQLAPEAGGTPCANLDKARDALMDSSVNEVDVPGLRTQLAKAMKGAQACPGFAKAQAALEAATATQVDSVQVAQGERIEVEVERDIPGAEPRRWSAVFTTGPRGRWFASYGFVFTPDDDELYFAKELGESQFQITREQDGGGFTFTPSIFYSWMPRRWEGRNFSGSLTGGLGFDMSNPAVFLGASLTFNHNLSLVGGGVIRKVKRLSGQYDPDDLPEVADALQPEQLLRDVYRPALFFGLAFRFGSNPFGGGDDSESEEPEEEGEEK